MAFHGSGGGRGAVISLERRAQEIRSRYAVRDWEYRQRTHANGVWTRMRRALAYAEEAWAIDEADAAALLAEGLAAEPVGAEVEPVKTLVFVPRDRIVRLGSRRRIAVRLDADFLATRAIALVPFE